MVRIEQNSEPIPGYRLINRIGSGGFGEVWKAEAPGGLHKAIKILHGHLASTSDKDQDGLRHAQQELKALKRIQAIRHPYLLSLERYDIVDNRLFIVMELADCNLWERFREFRALKQPGIPRRDLLQYLQEAAEVLDMMFFSYQLQHLDVKPQNLFLLHNHVKVADFGLVKELEGLQSVVTGGVTPVYAAPETLRGIVTPYCDQYSLAIVYQELLTGTRPFEGVNSTQLVMMHTHSMPNLGPLPAAERAIVGRAMAKIPGNRFPGCMDLIQALQAVRGEGEPLARSGGFTAPPTPAPSPPPEAEAYGSHTDTPNGHSPFRPTDAFLDNPSVPAQGIFTALPEITGNGSLRPAVVIGLGGAGLKVIRELRRTLNARYGLPGNLPHLRMLYIDTDPEKMQQIRDEGYFPYLQTDEFVHAKLNRSSYYLKPRRHGRPIIEGWFDPQLLYKLPRVPQTAGIRAFGRLAFVDHYRPIADKLEEFLLQVSHPDTLARADKLTRLGLWSNRPRVYIVAGLAGGTGGGMFIDVAQAARLKLRQLGYPEGEVVGLLQLPNVDRDKLDEDALANAYAGLRELHHYTQFPRSYTAVFDERDAVVKSPHAPYDRLHCFPYEANGNPASDGANPMKGRPEEEVVDLLTGELLSPFGKAADRLRGGSQPSSETSFHSTERAAHGWPRSLVQQALADWLCATVISRWVTDQPGVFEDNVRHWISTRWTEQGLTPEQLTGAFETDAAAAMGGRVEQLLARETQPILARGGWFVRDPEPAAIWEVVSRLRALLGSSEDVTVANQLSVVESAVRNRTAQALKTLPEAVVRVATALLEEPEYRLIGAIAANEMMANMLGQACMLHEQAIQEQRPRVAEALRLLNSAATADKVRVKSSILVAAASTYARGRLQTLYSQGIVEIYRRTIDLLSGQQQDLAFCRKQMADVLHQVRANAARPLPESKSLLLPFQAHSLHAAIERFKDTITPEDFHLLDSRLQYKIEKLCQLAVENAKKGKPVEASIQDVVEEEARAFISDKLRAVDFTAIYAERYPDPESLADSFRELFALAEPPHRPARSTSGEFCIVGLPESLAASGGTPRFPAIDLELCPAADEVYVYRECTAIPIKNLPQVGPLAEGAYLDILHMGANPHSRTDVPAWADIESEVALAVEV